MDITKLNIKGYQYNPDMASHIDTVFYDKIGNMDDWIEIDEDANDENRYIITYMHNAETYRIESIYKSNDIEKTINNNKE